MRAILAPSATVAPARYAPSEPESGGGGATLFESFHPTPVIVVVQERETPPPQSAADVLMPTAAARRLPMRTSDALAWLRTSGLVRALEGREWVIWGDVLDFIRDPTEGGARFLGA